MREIAVSGERVKSERVKSETVVAASPRLYIVNVTIGIMHRRETFRFALDERYILWYRYFAARENSGGVIYNVFTSTRGRKLLRSKSPPAAGTDGEKTVPTTFIFTIQITSPLRRGRRGRLRRPSARRLDVRY